MSETLAYAALVRQYEKLEKENAELTANMSRCLEELSCENKKKCKALDENANLLKLLHDHQNHWNTIGWAFGLCMGGVDGDVTDLHGNAAIIIAHCIDIAQRTQRETATACRDIAAESFRSDDSATTIAGAIAFRIKERFGLEI